MSGIPAETVQQLVQALRDISSHWATQPYHPRMSNPRYAGPYGGGLVDGHRSCKRIADKALAAVDAPTAQRPDEEQAN